MIEHLRNLLIIAGVGIGALIAMIFDRDIARDWAETFVAIRGMARRV